MDLSLVIPLYNEEESLPELHDWIVQVVEHMGLEYEILFIDDGSSDGSWGVIKALAQANPRVKGVSFRRNFGKSAALHVGFGYTRGQVIITMDADLQDSPEEIPELYDLIARQGYDLISGWKKKRYDPLSKTIPTKLFNWTTSQVSGIRLHDFNCGLKAYRRAVVKSIEVYGEMHRYIPVLAKWSGFRKIGEKVVRHQARKYGVTKFGLERFVNGFLDLLSITFVTRFGKRPMHFFGILGTLCFILGAFVAIYLTGVKVYKSLNQLPSREVTEQPLFYFALVAVVVGVQLFLAGFLGELVSRSAPGRNQYNKKALLNLTEEPEADKPELTSTV